MVVAHAGGSVLAGGDLFTGIDRAVGAGVPLIELDVRRTGDDVLVVHHGDRPGELSLADRLGFANLAAALGAPWLVRFRALAVGRGGAACSIRLSISC
jgi:glycerophosphoryl diester phosphodiesterase